MVPEEIIRLAQSLRAIDRRLLATEGVCTSNRVWYQGGEPYFDLFLELEEENIKWFQFTLRGNSISWQRYPNVWQTGKTQELQPRLNSRLQPASKIVEQDQQFDGEFGELVRSIILVRAEEPIFARLEALLQEMPREQSPDNQLDNQPDNQKDSPPDNQEDSLEDNQEDLIENFDRCPEENGYYRG